MVTVLNRRVAVAQLLKDRKECLVVTGLAQSIRADNGHIPWLDVTYDAQGSTNINTRLEAFMYQAGQYLAAQ